MYNYLKEKPKIFTEEGQEMFLKIRDNTHKLLNQSGAVMLQNAIKIASGDTWVQIACIDRLVELNEIKEITDSNVAGQHRVFVLVN